MEKETLEIYVYIHVKDGKVIYCGKGRKSRCVNGQIYDRAYNNMNRRYDVKDVEVKKIRYFNNEQDALYFEEKLTDYLKSIGQCEYNIDIANKCGEEHKRKMSESRKGKYTGEKHPMYGKHHTEETRKKISVSLKGLQTGTNHPMYGKHHSEETRRKLSESHKGENNPRSKPVIAFTDSGSYYKEFAYIKDAGRELGVDSSGITKCCKGKLKSLGKITINNVTEKLRWKYKE